MSRCSIQVEAPRCSGSSQNDSSSRAQSSVGLEPGQPRVPARDRETDGQAELAEAESPGRGLAQLAEPYVVREALTRGGEQALEEIRALDRAALEELRPAVGVGQKAAEAERVGRGELARLEHRLEVRARAQEARPARGAAELHGRGIELRTGHEAVQRIVLAHRGHERARQVHAQLPDHARRSASARPVAERGVRDLGELARPQVEARLRRRARDLVERVHPLRQVVEVLAVPVPLEPLVERLVGAALGQPLADAQTAARRVQLALALAQTAEPAAARVVGSVPPEHDGGRGRPDAAPARASASRPSHARAPGNCRRANASVHKYRDPTRSDSRSVRSAKLSIKSPACSTALASLAAIASW